MAGTHSLFVTDDQGCYEELNYNLTDPYFIQFGGIQGVTCPDDTVGVAIVNSSGCVCQFNTCIFTWSNGVVGMYGQDMPYGWNFVTIEHTGGCITLDSVFIPLTDAISPTIDAPADLTVNADAGQCGATIASLGTPIATDNCGIGAITQDAPTIFPLGITTVTWRVTDLNNNVATAIQTVTVIDTEAPVISCPSDITINANHSGCTALVTWPDPVVSDNCTASPVFSPSLPSGSVFPLGISIVSYNVEDSSGNSATCMFQIEVINNLSATATASNETQPANGSIDLTVVGGTAPYNYDWTGPDGFVSIDMNPSGLVAGSYEVTITDDNGCMFSLSAVVPIALGMATATQELEFLIYPNPTHNIARLQASAIDNYRVELSNSLGQRLSSFEFFGQDTELSLSELASGIYYCKVYSAHKNKEWVLKILKN